MEATINICPDSYPSAPDEVNVEGLRYEGVVPFVCGEGTGGPDCPSLLQTFLGGELVVYCFHLLGNYKVTDNMVLEREYNYMYLTKEHSKST